jgi:hypothetical protein
MAASRKSKSKTVKIPSDISTSKTPKTYPIIGLTKTPRWLGMPNIENIYMSWRFSKADLGGPYHCCNFSHDDYKLIWDRLRAFEGMNIDAFKRDGSLHDITPDKLSPDAQNRLNELQLDDVDTVYSFHIKGKCRLWCIRHLNIFCILWWDREHKAYLVPKKHT